MLPHAHFPDLPVEGDPEAGVRVVSFEDLQCRDCAVWRRMLDETLLPAFPAGVAFVTKDFPLPKHNWAEFAAMISRRLAVHDSRAAVDFRRYCFTHIADINLENLPDRAAEFALARGFPPSDAVLAMQSDDLRGAVEADRAEGRRLGLTHTPTVLVGERRFEEVFGAGEVEAAIRAELDERN
jgi:protein-disulfide isomerase